MLGRNHIALSVFSVALVAAPLLADQPYVVATLLAGVALGALLPDLDSASMRLLKSKVAPTWLLETVARKVLFTVLRVVYRCLFTRFDPEHRGSMHTILGVALTSLIIGGAAYLGLTYAGYWSEEWLWFLAGLPLGGLMHLVEDSTTRWGISPFEPVWEHRFRGRITTGNRRDLRPDIFSAVLAMALGGVMYLDLVRGFAKVGVLAGVTLLSAWGIFYIVAKIPVGGSDA
jgi:membrane-bound metal-dependent hydrolase YbcI (DUF457 family)